MSSQIFINGRFLTQNVTGVQRYAIELVKAIDVLMDSRVLDKNQVTFTLLAPNGHINELALSNISIKQVGFLSGHLWEQLELPIHARGHLLLNLCNTGPIVKREQVVTICDASVFAYPKAYSKPFRVWYQLLLPVLGRTSTAIITISEFSKTELIRFCKMVPEKIFPILLGVEQASDKGTDATFLDSHGLKGCRYVLAVSSMNPNKNFAGLAKAFELLGNVDYKVVIVGGTNTRVFGGDAIHLPEFVIQTGYVSDDELQVLYKHATCFVYPSFYEGFGLPPLEAMSWGCPVIVSEAASLPEVCGEAAIYCDPHSPADIARNIERLMGDELLRCALSKKGVERAKQFTWEKCARQTCNLLEKVMSK